MRIRVMLGGRSVFEPLLGAANGLGFHAFRGVFRGSDLMRYTYVCGGGCCERRISCEFGGRSVFERSKTVEFYA